MLRLAVGNGRFISWTDDRDASRTCVLGATIARQLFGYGAPVGNTITIGGAYYQVIGVLREQGRDPNAGGTLAWHDVNQSVFVPMAALSGRTLRIAPEQPADEVWIQVADSSRAEELGQIFHSALGAVRPERSFEIVVPRVLLAQRYRTQRTFSIVVGSVAALSLIVGGIGIMNVMLMSVIDRTREIGVRRTVGATRQDISLQFLVEALIMTLGGGLIGIASGALVAAGITAYAGWSTHVSVQAVGIAFLVSLFVGLSFGIYPALKAAALEPVDAMRHE
jgi:putative ABC transport system permease protein